MAEFSGMAGLGGLGVGILAWCHQQIRYEKRQLFFDNYLFLILRQLFNLIF